MTEVIITALTEAIEIKLDEIALKPELSPRDGIDQNVVKEYIECIADLPPILVALNKESFRPYVLIDGWHRYRAHQAAGHETIMAIVDKDLKPEDFYFRAICANKAHGIRLTAGEKIRISKYLFIAEHRSAAEISQAIGCSVRHATDLIKDLAHEKKQRAIELAKDAADRGFSERQIADYLQNLGYKASKSGVNRWLQPDPVPTVTVKDKDAIQVSPQIGESPKWAEPIVNDEPTTLVATELTPEDFEKLYCAKCKMDSLERTGKWYKITVDTVNSSTCFDFMICSFCRRALGRWVRNE